MRLDKFIHNRKSTDEIQQLIETNRPLTDEEYQLLKDNINFFNLLKIEGIDTAPYTPAEARFIEECKRRNDWIFGAYDIGSPTCPFGYTEG